MNEGRKKGKRNVRQHQYLHFGTLVQQQHAGLEDAPQLGPPLEGAAHLEPVRQHHHRWVLERAEQLPRHSLLLPTVLLPLVLVRLLAGEGDALQGEERVRPRPPPEHHTHHIIHEAAKGQKTSPKKSTKSSYKMTIQNCMAKTEDQFGMAR